MKFVLFCHSFLSCWNHGNAHFLRGVARELLRAGNRVTAYEPHDGWSCSNLLRDHGPGALEDASRTVPGVEIRTYRPAAFDADLAVHDADVVLVHEWTDPEIVAALGRCRIAGGRFLLLFHDTHHRAVSAADEIEGYDLDGYDGVLAFGEILREVYLRRGWARRAFTWHEAADTKLFRPLGRTTDDADLIWIGNWGDGERDCELQEFLLRPVAALGLRARVHGVRYPAALRERLAQHGIRYEGWLPNHRVPQAFANARTTVHIPRRPYVENLPGIPTIRMFEALACGIPLVSAPWDDVEGLFPPGSYLRAADGEQMTVALALLLGDREFAAEQARIGHSAIETRHTCAIRVQQLLGIIDAWRSPHRGIHPARASERQAQLDSAVQP
jgi:spore maturation protein CgeB